MISNAEILVYLAIVLGVVYAALLPWYKKNQELIAAGLPPVGFDKKYIAAIIVNLALNAFVALVAISEYQEHVGELNSLEAGIGALLAAFIWGAQSQRIVALIPDWLMARTGEPGGASLPQPPAPKT